jgi:omega-6 fatty acid desaturase (delta-12 desaturase)
MKSNPLPKEVRGLINEEKLHEKSYVKGLLLLGLVAICYYLTFWGAVSSPIAVRPFISLLCGISISVLFVIAHDACHRCFTPSRWLDGVIGRFCFLPSYFPFNCWRVGHNRIHHGYTLLKPHDYNWTPMSPKEYSEASILKRAIERHYKSWLGIATNWAIEIWWKHGLFPRQTDRAFLAKRANETILDYLLTAVFLAGQLVFVNLFGEPLFFSSGTVLGLVENAFYAIVFPFWVFCFIAGLVALTQHTHPSVVWFDNKEDWSFFSTQVQGTVHFKFPFPLNKLFLNVMEHTAHHVDPSIPVYNLVAPQKILEEAYPDDVIVEEYSFQTISWLLKTCQLYDFRSRCWTNFEGVPTTDPCHLGSRDEFDK